METTPAISQTVAALLALRRDVLAELPAEIAAARAESQAEFERRLAALTQRPDDAALAEIRTALAAVNARLAALEDAIDETSVPDIACASKLDALLDPAMAATLLGGFTQPAAAPADESLALNAALLSALRP